MKYSAVELCKRQVEASVIKSSWDNEYKQVFDYCMPSRNGFNKADNNQRNNAEFQDNRENQYSSVGEQSCCDFVNTMQEVLCPPMADWISLEAGVNFAKEDRQQVNAELNKICEVANEYKNHSAFDMAFSEFCYDVFAGTGCLLVLPGTPTQPLLFKAIPIKEYSIEEGSNGEVCFVYRSFSMKRELLARQWPELKNYKPTKDEADKDIQLLEATYYDADKLVYYYCVINTTTKVMMLEKEYRTNPFVVLRWNKAAGEPYGRGCGLTALNDIKTLNLVKEYSLRNFAYNIPPLLVQEDGMIDVDSLELTPFSLNVVPNTQTSIVPLQLNTDHDIESYKVQELTMDIKRNTYGNTLPNEGARQLTATEILARQAEMRRSLNSVFGRLVAEFQLPLVRRIFDILIDVKIIKDPKQEFNALKINGLTFKVKVNTPIARQLMIGQAQAIVQSVTMLTQLDPTGAMLNSLLKVNKMGVKLMAMLGVPSEFINSEDEVESKQSEQAQQAQAMQQQAVQQNVDAENAMAVGASQAKALENPENNVAI